MTPPNNPNRIITTILTLAGLSLIVWGLLEYNLLLIAWVGAALGLFLLAVLAVVAWRKGLRWFFSRKGLRFHFWVAAGLVSVVLLFYAEESWRGKRSWAKLQRELDQRGESIGLDSVIPAPVPDELNFAAAPGVAALLGIGLTNSTSFQHGDPHDWPSASWARGEFTDFAKWHGLVAPNVTGRTPKPTVSASPIAPAQELLLALHQFDAPLEALRRASARPHCRYPFSYEDAWLSLSGKIFDNLHNAGSVLRLRACAELRLDDPAAALQDVLLLLRLADTLKGEPFVVAHRLRLEMLMFAVQPVWEGLASHRWRVADLTVLQERFAAMEPRGEFRRVAKGETILMMHLASQFEAFLDGQPSRFATHLNQAEGADAFALWLVKAFYPEGWLAQDKVWLYRFYQRCGTGDTDPRRMPTGPEWKSELRRIMDPNLPIFVVPRLRMAMEDSLTWGLYVEVVAQQVLAACALERFRFEKGAYPETMTALNPEYLAGMPADPCASPAQPMPYQPAKEGYRIYSVGANGSDEGGKIDDHKERWRGGESLLPRLERGDWVWAVPPISP